MGLFFESIDFIPECFSIRFVNCEFTTIEFYFTNIYHTILPVNQEINL